MGDPDAGRARLRSVKDLPRSLCWRSCHGARVPACRPLDAKPPSRWRTSTRRQPTIVQSSSVRLTSRSVLSQTFAYSRYCAGYPAVLGPAAEVNATPGSTGFEGHASYPRTPMSRECVTRDPHPRDVRRNEQGRGGSAHRTETIHRALEPHPWDLGSHDDVNRIAATDYPENGERTVRRSTANM